MLKGMGKNKVIWITGASKGIGKAIGKRLMQSNNKIIFSSSNKNTLRDLVEEIGMSTNVFFFPCDVSDAEQVMSTNEKISNTIGNVDILINNAGVANFKSFNESTLEQFESMTNVNFRGVYLCSKAVLPEMINKKKGMILNITSVAVFDTFLNASIYSATKAAVHKMAEVMRNEVRKDGIKIVNVSPGATISEIWSQSSLEKYRDQMMVADDVALTIDSIISQYDNDRLMIEDIRIRPQKGDL